MKIEQLATFLLKSSVRSLPIITMSVVTAMVWLAALANEARAGDQFVRDTANCSGSSSAVPPTKLCRTSWQGPNTTMNIRAVDQYSGQAPWLVAAVQAAVNSWYNAPGPIRASFSPQPNDSYVFYKTGTNSGPYLLPGEVGITRMCTSSSCSVAFFVANFQYSEIYMNREILNQAYVGTSGGVFKAQWTAAHELGHAVLLDHHPRGSCPGYNIWTSVLMRPCADEGPGVNGPVGWDLGTLIDPPCIGTAGQKGVRCVFRWTVN